MAPALEQRGTGNALVIFTGPAGPGDNTTAPGLPAASKAALGPSPWIVTVNARGPEGLQQILGFARVQRPDLWLAAVIAFSAGGQKLRQLRLESLKLAEPGALAWVAIDAMHSQKPPLALHVQAARDLAAQARAGALAFVLAHTYIQPDAFTSTAEMARRATDWTLAKPPVGQTVVRTEAPAGGPRAWSGGLAVYSTGSTPADTAAHIWQAQVLMPHVLGRHVRPLVELDARPDVQPAIIDPKAPRSPEPGPVALEIGSPGVAASSRKPPGPTMPVSYTTGQLVVEQSRILLIGDSLAVGLQKPLRERATRLGVPFGSTAQVSTTIHQWLTGKGLARSLDAAIEQAQPTLTLVSLGTNDMRGRDPAAAGREGGQFVDLLLRSGAGTVGWLLPPKMPFGDRGFLAALQVELGKRGIRSFDASSLTVPRASDGIHPTAAGYDQWGEAIAAWWPFSLLAAGAFPAPSEPVPAPAPPPSPAPLPAAVSPLSPYAPVGDVWVAGLGRMRFDPDYVARVVTAENGRARSLEGLKALAVAARTYAHNAMNRSPGLGTAAKPLPNGENFQVCARAPASLCQRAAVETKDGYALYRGQLVTANHVAGATWTSGEKKGVGAGPGNTERLVTYNEGKRGAEVRATPIGGAGNPQNRGCLSQNGAEALGRVCGYRFGDILRFFYGDDVDLTIAEYHVPAPPGSPRPAAPASSGEGIAAVGAVALGLAVMGAVT